jgi:hypothetical protein
MLIVTAVAALALLALPAAALAKRGDRNHDRIPDKWERNFHLSLKVNQANKDQDHDGLNNKREFQAGDNPRDADTDNDGKNDLNNKREFQAGDNPRDADTDNDGKNDGQENPGTVAHFDSATGTLTINTASGPVTGKVTNDTEIECDSEAENEQEIEHPQNAGAPVAGEHNNGEHNDGEHPDSHDKVTAAHDGGSSSDDAEKQADQSNCGPADLVDGARVHEAELELQGDQAVWKKVELLK